MPSERWSRRAPRGEDPQRVMECRVCGDGTKCGLGTATGCATAEGDSVRAAAVFSKPLLGFLPFGRCCVIPFLGCDFQGMSALAFRQPTDRSEERRVGKEYVSTCRSRWSPYHEKKKTNTN